MPALDVIECSRCGTALEGSQTLCGDCLGYLVMLGEQRARGASTPRRDRNRIKSFGEGSPTLVETTCRPVGPEETGALLRGQP